MKRRYRTLRPVEWLVLGSVVAIFCALLVFGTIPLDAPGAARAPV